MKYAREIKVGVVAIICLSLLYFGFNFLKGVNIFSPVYGYHGIYTEVPGLTEQAPVYIRGYKVGQVDKITYDFTKDSAFLIDISIDKHIVLPQGTHMALVSDGLLGGNAIELVIPTGASLADAYTHDSYLPTTIVPGLMESLQDGLLNSLSETVNSVQDVVNQLAKQLDNNHIESVLENVDDITEDLTATSRDLKKIIGKQVPAVVEHVDVVVGDLGEITTSLRDANIVAKVDTVVANVNGIVEAVQSEEGTVGKLLYDKSLYTSLNATVVSADSLLTDLKANPKRYVHFSLFGAKDKTKK